MRELLSVFVLFGVLLHFVNSDVFEFIKAPCPETGSFMCTNGECLPNSKRCDGNKDCKDWSDEEDCDEYLCKKPRFFRCPDGNCLPQSFLCDGQDDCGDLADEMNCGNATIKMLARSEVNCTKGQWRCANKRQCISEEYVCDSRKDCSDHSDEDLGCTMHIPCDTFKCANGHCIPHEWQCDGNDDCHDNSDEKDCETKVKPEDCLLEKGYYLCNNNKTCIQLSKVCDSVPQCPDKSDEGLRCTAKNECLTHNCTHSCVMLPTGPKCLCPAGYHTLDDRHCTDINECEIYGICDQKCRNTPGSYECLCDHKYILQEDKRTCKGGDAMLIFSTKKHIRGYLLQSKLYFPLVKNLNQAIGVAYDGHFIYWTDISGEQESIMRMGEVGKRIEVVLSAGLGTPEDLAVDWVTNNIYFTDAEFHHIGVCTNDGVHCTILVNKDIHKPRGIVLDPNNGEMYWSDWGKRPEIAKSLMDGTKDVSFVSNDIYWPNGLAIDHPNERLYWTDAKKHTVESIKLDGTNRRIIMEGIVKHPYGIAVYEDRLYWSDWGTNTLESCNKFNGKDHHTIISEGKNLIYGVHIFHSAMKTRADNPCSFVFCSHICLLKGTKHACACPEDMVLGSDNHTCHETSRKQMLAIGSSRTLLTIHHQRIGKHNTDVLPTVAKDIGAIAYNSLKNALFVNDLAIKMIFQYDLVNELMMPLNISVAGNIGAMDFDHLGNNLYWCDMDRQTVEVFNLNTGSRKVILHDLADEIPQSLVVVPEEGFLFVSLLKQNQRESHIDRLNMDGSGRIHLAEHQLQLPIVLHYSSELGRIFWADGRGMKIESVDIHGQDRKIFRNLMTPPVAITSLNKTIFWTCLKSNMLFYADFGTQFLNKRLHLDASSSTPLEHLTAITPKPYNIHDCHTQNGNCSHLCIPLLKHKICACPTGMRLGHDEHTCFTQITCDSSQFFCHESNTCIPREMRCNNHKDCPNNEDESDCKKPNHCPLDYFQCNNGECIDENLVCNSHYDCKDKSDENECQGYRRQNTCPSGFYKCPERHCISEISLCDGQRDCKDGSDEVNCEATTCKSDQFRCNSGTCIPNDWECDGDFDCTDMSDEHAKCNRTVCPEDMYQCLGTGACIDRSLECDGVDDCGDLSDEIFCMLESFKLECGRDKFTCESNKTICLPNSAKCNGTQECPDNSDEKGCGRCYVDEFECDNYKCIPDVWVCDKNDDCGDKSDETPSLCHMRSNQEHNQSVVPCKDGFRCKTGHCIKMNLVCNGKDDCSDGSDENGACTTSCQHPGNPCSQLCQKTPLGPICRCSEGYRLRGDGHSCADVEECSLDPSPCSQMCTEMQGSFVCSCYEGFSLRGDKKSCKAQGNPMALIYTMGNQIRQMTRHNRSLNLLYWNETPKISGLDVSLRTGFVYFTIDEIKSIVRINLRNHTRDYIPNMGTPQKLAVDWISDNIYFVEAESHSVRLCHFEARKCAVLFYLEKDDLVTALTVDAINRYIFYSVVNWWIDFKPHYRIYRANLDGTNIVEVTKTTSGYISGLTFDSHKHILYSADRHNGYINMLKYGSFKPTTIIANISKPSGLQLFEDHLYFIGANKRFGKCSLFGEARSCIDYRFSADPEEHFVVAQESKQMPAVDTCLINRCSYMCVRGESGVKCLCENGRVVKEGEQCAQLERLPTVEDKPILSDQKKPPTLSKPIVKTSRHSSALTVGILLPICMLLVVLSIYYVIRRKRSGKFNVSIRFYNQGYGLESEEPPMPILQPGQHEYYNPVDFPSKDMENVSNSVLKKVQPLVNLSD